MSDYTNASASPSALFDNAPTWYARSDTATLTHLIPATRIAQDRNGKWYPHDVDMQYGRPVPLALALKRVATGRTVFVRREDAKAVMEAVRGGGNGETS